MKAIVMAGGDGTRLQPLTGVRPKPMVELLDKPVLLRTVEHLKRHGFTDILMTLRYLPREIEDYFGDGSDFGVNIEHRVEMRPLGTAGSVRCCADFIGDEDVLIVSGDAVMNFDLTECADFHKRSAAEATLLLFEHPEPTSYGLVITDDDGRVTAFSEKPAWERVTTNMVNTGIYFISPEIISLIPEGEPCDFGKDLFPRLLREGRRLYGHPAVSYWCDIGSPEAYRSCCMDALAGRVGITPEVPEVAEGIFSASPLTDVELTPLVYVGADAVIAAGAKLGPNAVISGGTRLGEGTRVRESVICGADVGRWCDIDGAVLSRGAVVGDGAEIKRGCVVGDGAVIGAGCVLSTGVRVWTDRRAPEGRRVTRSIVGESPEHNVSVDGEGVMSGRLGAELSPELLMSIGAKLGAHGPVGVAFTGGEGARLLADAAVCGVTGAGGECFEFDAEFERELAAISPSFAVSRAVFLREEESGCRVTFLDGWGEPIGASARRELEGALEGCGSARTSKVGGITRVSGVPKAYLAGLLAELSALYGGGTRCPVTITGSGAENRALTWLLKRLGFESVEREAGLASVSVARGGFGFTATDERGRVIDELHGGALAAEALMRLGVRTLHVPQNAPAAIGRLAVRYGCKLTSEPREGAHRLLSPLSDGILAAAASLIAAAREGTELSLLYDGLPPFAVVTRRVDVACSRAKAMRLMAAGRNETAEELGGGLTYNTAKGRIRVSPSPDGSALELRGEGADMEAARELCGEFEKLARDVTSGEN